MRTIDATEPPAATRRTDAGCVVPTMQVRDALREGIARLNSAAVPSSALSAELLLMHVLMRDRTWLYAHPDDAIESSIAETYFALVARRASGEPTQYIVGKQEFWGLEFGVTPAVLIPRPETEHLIEVALERLSTRRDAALRIADIGTGSGCIAVALAKEFQRATIIATDISPAALEVAKANAHRNEVADRIEFIETNLLGAFFHQARIFDLVVSNPPYVARNEAATLPREVREHEPEIALFGGETGVEIYGRLIEQAEALLTPSGALIVELGYGSAEQVRVMVDKHDAWQNVSITNDLAGIPRVLAAQRT